MRLTQKQVDLIITKIITLLKQKQLIKFKKPEGSVVGEMKKAFIDNLQAEDRIQEEAKTLLAQYARKSNTPIDEQKMLQMIKKELAKKYHVII